ncbi:hypothetical protein ACOMHN_030531 [Nucella lapillus]
MSNPTYHIHTPEGNITSPFLPPPHFGQRGSGLGEEGEEGSYSVGQKVVLGSVLTLMVLVAVAGNLLVCAAVLTDRRLKNNSNFFIVSLAIADLLMALGVMTFAIANDIQGRWMFGAAFCRIWISADVMCSTASILNLCVISLDRYVHIKDPLHYELWMTTRKTAAFIGSVWGMSVLISFLPIHLGWHQAPTTAHSDHHTQLCVFDLNPVYAIVSSTISFYIPCVVMVSIYARLYMYARRHVLTIRRTQTAGDRFQEGAKSRVSDHKAAVTLGIIMGVFLLCWMPFFVINPILALCSTCVPQLVYQILTWCGYVNSCLNPVIYSIFNTEFRDAFRTILFPSCFLESRIKQQCAGSPSAGSRSRLNKARHGPPPTDNGASTPRRSSKEKLFADRITSV